MTDARSASLPALFGEIPPVTRIPTPPLARLAKNFACLSKPSGISSRPVCIDPINTRFLSVVNPRSSGASR